MTSETFDLSKNFLAVCVVVKYDDKTLILRRKDWAIEESNHSDLCFPGGKQDNGEHAVNAAVRELYEETNVKIACDGIEYLGYRFIQPANNNIVFFGARYFSAMGTPKIMESDKHSFVGFLAISDVINEITLPRISPPVLKYLRS